MNKNHFIKILFFQVFLCMINLNAHAEKVISLDNLWVDENNLVFEKIIDLNNTFWIPEIVFTEEQLQTNEYQIITTPGFIFVKNFVLIISITWIKQISNNEVQIEMYASSIDGAYNIVPLKPNHFQTAIYEIWISENKLHVKQISETLDQEKVYTLKKSFWSEL